MLKHALTLLLLFVMTCTAHWAWAQPTEQALADLAGQAYIFGYPLLTMDASMRTMSAPEAPGGPSLVNRFSHKPAFPDPGFTDVVSPNADTLYSIAWLDLKGSPMVFSLPEMAERYYLMQLIDGWTNDFISLGTRSTGNRPGEYLIAGPGWQGKLPEGMRLIKAPGNMVWILGRIQTNGTADYAAVQALQQRFVLRPLLENAASPAVPKPDKGSPLEQVEGLNAQDFFARLNRLMLDTPPRVRRQALAGQTGRALHRAGPDL